MTIRDLISSLSPRTLTTSLFFVALLSFNSCTKVSQVYPNNNLLSFEDGTPVDSTAPYFPAEYGYSRYISNTMRYYKEPLLNNYYLGHDMVRFTVFNGYFGTQIFTAERHANAVLLSWTHDENTFAPLYTRDTLYTMKIRSTREILPASDWTKLDSTLTAIRFWEMPYFVGDTVPFKHEGNIWYIEAHYKNKYKIIKAALPPEPLFLIADFFMHKSNLWENQYAARIYLVARRRMEIDKKYAR